MVRLYLLLILLVTLPIATADIIHDEWHRYRDSFEADDIVYRVQTFPGDYDRLRLTTDSHSVTINVGECRQNVGYVYCYENYTFDSDLVEIDSTNQFAPAVRLIIERLDFDDEGTPMVIAPDISITREFEESPFIDNTYEYKTIVKNNGNDWAYDLRYQVIAPEGLELTRGNFVRFGTLLYTPNIHLPPGGERIYSFEYTPKEEIKKDFEYLLTYDGEGEVKKEGSHTINSRKVYDLTYELNPSSMDLQGQSQLRIVVFNLLDEPIYVDDLSISHPSHLTTRNQDNFVISRRGLLTTNVNTIEEGSSTEFKINLVSDRVGDFNIGGVIKLLVGNRVFEEEIDEELEVTTTGVSSDLTLNKHTVRSGSEVNLKHVLKNNNQNLNFENFRIEITSDFFNENYTLDQLLRRRSNEFSKTITIPQTDSNLEFEVKAEVTYDITSTQEELIEESEKLRVRGEGEYFRIRHNFDKSRLERGEDVSVAVEVHNELDDFFSRVDLQDTVSGNAEVISGTYHEQYSFQGKQTRNVYIYRVAIPDNYALPFLEINTFANVDSIDYGQIGSSRIPVNVPEDEVVNDSEEEPSQPERPSEVNEESGPREIEVVSKDQSSDNFLTRWITRFGDFIQGLI